MIIALAGAESWYQLMFELSVKNQLYSFLEIG